MLPQHHWLVSFANIFIYFVLWTELIHFVVKFCVKVTVMCQNGKVQSYWKRYLFSGIFFSYLLKYTWKNTTKLSLFPNLLLNSKRVVRLDFCLKHIQKAVISCASLRSHCFVYSQCVMCVPSQFYVINRQSTHTCVCCLRPNNDLMDLYVHVYAEQ